MKRIAIIGVTGMLGSAMYGVLRNKYEIVRTFRDPGKLALLDKKYPGATKCRSVILDAEKLYQAYIHKQGEEEMGRVVTSVGPVDMVINCAGIIRPNKTRDQSLTFFTNGALPHILSAHYTTKLIHISTDCVFSGKTGAPYSERSPISPVDVYGISKSVGEPSMTSLVIRTSLIGHELRGDVSLLGWMLRRPPNSRINGYTDHIWNGITTTQCAKVCDEIISRRDHFPKAGLVHIYSKAVTKYELLRLAANRWRQDLQVVPTKSNDPTDRRLTSVFEFCKNLSIPRLEAMLGEVDATP